MNERQLNDTLIGIHHRLQWINDARERADWVKLCEAQHMSETEWARLIWMTEDLLDKVETLGGRPCVPHCAAGVSLREGMNNGDCGRGLRARPGSRPQLPGSR